MRYLFITFSFLYISNSFSQTHIVKGKITDSLQNTLAFANVVAESFDKKRQTVFAITDEDGLYLLSVKSGKRYKATVYYLGYKPYTFLIDSISNNLVKNVVLKQLNDQLGEVVIKIDMPVSIKEDTIIYNVKKFTNGNERKLKDILKKLPGIEVDRKGNITAMGKEVNILLVDNKPFFGGSTKLGVNNIPSDVIDKIEILEDYNAVSFMKGFSKNKRSAINIKLKKNKKQFFFGDIGVGVGNNNSYAGNANIFFYSPTKRMNFIGNANNIGQEAITMSDIMRMEGSSMDFSNFEETYKTIKWLSKFMASPYYTAKSQELGAFQLQNSFKNNAELNVYYILLSDNIQMNSLQKKNYLMSGIYQNVNSLTERENLMGKGKISLSKNFGLNNFLKLNINTNFANINSLSNIVSTVNHSDGFIKSKDGDKFFSLNSNLIWQKKYNNKKTISFKARFSIDDVYQKNNWHSSQFYLENFINYQAENNLQILQNTVTKQQRFMVEAKYYYSINLKNHLYTTVGNYLQKDHYKTNAFQKLSNGNKLVLLNNGFYTDIKRDVNDAYIGMTYKTRISKVILRMTAFSHYYYSNPENKELYINNVSILPELSLKTKIKYTQDFSINYHLENSLAQTNTLSNAYYFNNYSVLFKGNSNLVNVNNYKHKVKIYYRNFKLRRHFSYHLILLYSYAPNPIKNVLFYYDTNSLITPVTIDKPHSTYKLTSTYKKIYTNWYASLSYMGGLQYYYQKLQDVNRKIETNNHNVKFKIGNKHKNYPNVDTSIQWAVNEKIIDSKPYKNQNIVFELDENYEFSKNYFSNISVKTVKNLYEGNSDSFTISSLSLYYNKDGSPWSFEVDVQNVFNVSSYHKYTINEIIMNDYKSFVRNRTFVFKVGYKL